MKTISTILLTIAIALFIFTFISGFSGNSPIIASYAEYSIPSLFGGIIFVIAALFYEYIND